MPAYISAAAPVGSVLVYRTEYSTINSAVVTLLVQSLSICTYVSTYVS